MNQNTCQLRAIVAERDGGFEAQLLEIDLAARGKSRDEMLAALGHAIHASYEISKEMGETPFININSAPIQFYTTWKVGKSPKQIGIIHLPTEVAEALAIALRVERPISEIPVFEKCAA